MSEIRIVSDPAALSRAAAAEFVTEANAAVQARGVFQVALSGGSTPQGLFTLLAGDASLRSRTPWDQVQFWWGDERHVPPDHPDSNYGMAHKALLSRIQVAAGNVHRIHSEFEDAAQAALDYENELRAGFISGAQPLPRFDLILLGMGSEGHTASLFPGTRALNETTRLVVPNWVGKLYTWRITMTAPLINRARSVLFLIAGEDKALALKGVLEGPHEPSQLPAQLIAPADGRLVWLLDQKAAARLSH